MLRTVFLALLLGLAGSLGLLQLVIAPQAQGAGDRTFDLAAAAVGAGEARAQGDGLRVTLDAAGSARIGWPLDGLVAERYPFLHLALAEYPPEFSVTLIWWNADRRQQEVHELETRPRDSLLLAIREFHQWTGAQAALGLRFDGPPGATLRVADVGLRGPGLLRELHAIADDWSGFTPWRRSAVNSHDGVTRTSPFYPVPMVAVLLVLALGACALLSKMRGGAAPPWSALGLVFLACWLLLDAKWQYELLQQLAETRRQFAGLTPEEKRAAGPDAQLYAFVRRARDLLEGPDARVFVSSSDDYLGLRAAYYLLPHNTYFELRDQPLPPRRYLHSGDYILVVQPSSTRLIYERGLAVTPQGNVPVKPLLQDRGNSLSRVP